MTRPVPRQVLDEPVLSGGPGVEISPAQGCLHLRAVVAETPNRSAALAYVQPFSTTHRARRSLPVGVKVALAWDTKTSVVGVFAWSLSHLTRRSSSFHPAMPTGDTTSVVSTARAASYAPATESEFLTSPMAQDAICMRLQEVGENLSKIRRHVPDFYAKHESEGWHRLIGLRNVISHGYAEVDMHIVWSIMEVHLGPLTEELQALLTTQTGD